MAHYWQRVTLQTNTPTYSDTGAEVAGWADALADLEARVSPLAHDEKLQVWATPEEEAYEVQLRGVVAAEPHQRLVHDGSFYDIREVLTPPPFGTPATVLHVVKVTP